jgi:hypothetical protein
MADTGAPWNIPYVEPGDLVRDYPAADEAQALAISAGLDEAIIALGPNVAQTVKTDTFTTTSASFVDITGMSVTITPSSATSKVLVVVDLSTARGGAGTTVARVNLLRDSTNIAQPTTGTNPATINLGMPETTAYYENSLVFLDSPNTASAVTYKLQVAVSQNTFNVNLRNNDTNSTMISTITAIEVAA